MNRPSNVALAIVAPSALLALAWSGVRTATVAELAKPGASGSGPIVMQETVGVNSCGPCALFHCLAWGDKKLQSVLSKLDAMEPPAQVEALIENYLSTPSEAYAGKRARYEATSGITWIDLAYGVDDLCAEHKLPPVESGYLDLHDGETLSKHVRRVHASFRDSLSAGFPPLLSIRSFLVDQQDGKFTWRGVAGHGVAVVEVQPELGDEELGFRIGFVDSDTGKQLHGYAHASPGRNFTAMKGDFEQFEWVTDRPFLLLTAPRPFVGLTQDVAWWARDLLTLDFAIRRGK